MAPPSASPRPLTATSSWTPPGSAVSLPALSHSEGEEEEEEEEDEVEELELREGQEAGRQVPDQDEEGTEDPGRENAAAPVVSVPLHSTAQVMGSRWAGRAGKKPCWRPQSPEWRERLGLSSCQELPRGGGCFLVSKEIRL